ncbi:LysM domain-containing protein [Penicillium rolfsii]|nr:LysM domain-containing protein [Penicillium rolfsii]
MAPMASDVAALYFNVTSLRQSQPDLEVWISIGGWAFNDDDQPTKTTFSDLAASETAQTEFFGSLITFLVKYGFTGVDIDWEYPAADDRNGRAEDYVNYVTFLRNLRRALDGTGLDFGLSITIPSSYWYMQHFDIVSIDPIVSWFNIMTYDLHGTWDGNDPYIGTVALAHTNLTEIEQSLELLWRNNIEPSKVNLGLGFYGRSFTMSNPDCLAAGCPFSGGGNPGPCTNSSGILSVPEIQNAIAGGATVVLDQAAAVKIVTWDTNQWVSYDDAETMKTKIDFANEHCLGGYACVSFVSRSLGGRGLWLFKNISELKASDQSRRQKDIQLGPSQTSSSTGNEQTRCVIRMKIHFSFSFALFAYLCLGQVHYKQYGSLILHQRATTTSEVSVLSSPDEPTKTGTINTCSEWYDVVEGDSCWSITTAFGITQAEFTEWNPAVGSSCIVVLGYSYCVGVGTGPTSTSTSVTSTTPSSTSLNSTIATSTTTTATPYSTLSYNVTTNPVTITQATWPPTQTQPGQPSYCINWYQALQNDDCDSIVSKYSTWMDLNDFLDWNPAVGENCTAVYYGYWYCVGIQPQTTWVNNGSATSMWYPSWTYIAPPAMNTTFVPSPVQTGIASDCQEYYITEDGDDCTNITSSLGFLTEEQFIEWNPAVGTDCSGIETDYYYCVWNGTSLPLPSVAHVLPSPVQTGIISSCTAWYQADDEDTCDLIVEIFGTFSKSDFLSWNPALESDCSGLAVGDYYCVAVPGSPTSRTISVSSLPTPTTPANTISYCDQFWLVETIDNCTTIAIANGVSVSDLETWNPSLGSDCSGLTANTYICVGIPDNSTTTITTATTNTLTGLSTSATSSSSATTPTISASTSTLSAGPTPTPFQAGMTSGCVRFYYVETNNDCYDIALDAGIALSDFYAWNPAIKSDCSGLQANVYVCVGQTGYSTTISTGNPVPATPTPTQTGMVSGCLRFYEVQSGNDCYDIALDAGVALTDFYNWNQAVGSNCAGLELGVFVCIGTIGPVTTITSGPPSAVAMTSG